MNGRLAAAGTAVGLAAGSALVVGPSATIRVTGASRPVSATARVRLDEVGARSIEVGTRWTEATVPTTGVLPATPATGAVTFQYDRVGALYFLGGFFDCFLFDTHNYCEPSSPAAPKRLTLPAGTRLMGCPSPIADPPAPPCTHPMAMVTTAPAPLALGNYTTPIPVRTLAAGPAGNFLQYVWLTDDTGFDRYYPHVGVRVRLDGDMQGGGDAGRPAVTQADVDKATAMTRTQLNDMALASASKLLQPGETMAAPLQDASFTIRPPDARVGAVAFQVTVSGAISGNAVAVSTEALRRAATAALQRAAGDRRVIADSVRWDPQIEPDGQTVRIAARGATTDLDSYMVRSAAAWHGGGHVAEVIHRFDPQATVSVTGNFGWSPALVFLDRRATVEIDGYPLN